MRRPLAVYAIASAFAMPAEASDWAVDHTRSSLGFEVTIDSTQVKGDFATWDAAISFDNANLGSAHVKATIDLATAESGNGTRDKALKTATWFDTDHTPEATFQTVAFRQTGEGSYEADATLIMRGVASPVTLPFTLKIVGDEAHMTARLTIDRTLWGVGQGEYQTGTPVATKVDVVIDLTARAL